MSSFTMVLLEEGVEMELPVDLSEAISILDQEVPWFACEGYGYELASVSRAQLGSRWDLLVKLSILATKEVYPLAGGTHRAGKAGQSQRQVENPPASRARLPRGYGVRPGWSLLRLLNLPRR